MDAFNRTSAAVDPVEDVPEPYPTPGFLQGSTRQRSELFELLPEEPWHLEHGIVTAKKGENLDKAFATDLMSMYNMPRHLLWHLRGPYATEFEHASRNSYTSYVLAWCLEPQFSCMKYV